MTTYASTSTKIHRPIYTALIAGRDVRFFRAPSGRPEMPFHAADDLFLVLGFNRPMRRFFAQAQQRNFGDLISTVATTDGPVVLAPHCAAQGLIGAAEEAAPDRVPPDLAMDYAKAAAAALENLAGDLPPSAWVDFLTTAARNSGYDA